MQTQLVRRLLALPVQLRDPLGFLLILAVEFGNFLGLLLGLAFQVSGALRFLQLPGHETKGSDKHEEEGC